MSQTEKRRGAAPVIKGDNAKGKKDIKALESVCRSRDQMKRKCSWPVSVGSDQFSQRPIGERGGQKRSHAIEGRTRTLSRGPLKPHTPPIARRPAGPQLLLATVPPAAPLRSGRSMVVVVRGGVVGGAMVVAIRPVVVVMMGRRHRVALLLLLLLPRRGSSILAPASSSPPSRSPAPSSPIRPGDVIVQGNTTSSVAVVVSPSAAARALPDAASAPPSHATTSPTARGLQVAAVAPVDEEEGGH